MEKEAYNGFCHSKAWIAAKLKQQQEMQSKYFNN